MKNTSSHNKTSTKAKESYHHGDLRTTLLITATAMINEGGIQGLSLRKLAERIGVSRTAAYHHFKDKNDLLSAIAAQGFITWQQQSEQIFNNNQLSDHDKYKNFVHAYVTFATDNPSLYDLMFGSTLWKENHSSDLLKEVAYPSFQYQVEMTKKWQAKGLMNKDENTLRLAQVSWGTLHGIARLVIDGIYADASNIDEMCDCVVNLFLSQ
jgi:AcrR family transcriptional regulator